MRTLTTKTHLALLMVMVFLLSGCSLLTNSGTIRPASPQPTHAGDTHSRQIEELNRRLQQNANSSETGPVHLELARLYAHYNNHQRDYQKALEHLQAFIRLEQSPVDDNIRNWLASLKEIDRLSKEIDAHGRRIAEMQDQLEESKKAKSALHRSNRKLRHEEIRLRDKNRKLEASNQKLQKTIEMLQNLDRRLEEKRRNFNSQR